MKNQLKTWLLILMMALTTMVSLPEESFAEHGPRGGVARRAARRQVRRRVRRAGRRAPGRPRARARRRGRRAEVRIVAPTTMVA